MTDDWEKKGVDGDRIALLYFRVILWMIVGELFDCIPSPPLIPPCWCPSNSISEGNIQPADESEDMTTLLYRLSVGDDSTTTAAALPPPLLLFVNVTPPPRPIEVDEKKAARTSEADLIVVLLPPPKRLGDRGTDVDNTELLIGDNSWKLSGKLEFKTEIDDSGPEVILFDAMAVVVVVVVVLGAVGVGVKLFVSFIIGCVLGTYVREVSIDFFDAVAVVWLELGWVVARGAADNDSCISSDWWEEEV